jgi:hypothetical protein
MTLAGAELNSRMTIQTHVEPGGEAPATGVYQELNVFGTLTGRWKSVRAGDRLPRAPIMFSWRLVWQNRAEDGGGSLCSI